jgi:hypothetical protein
LPFPVELLRFLERGYMPEVKSGPAAADPAPVEAGRPAVVPPQVNALTGVDELPAIKSAPEDPGLTDVAALTSDPDSGRPTATPFAPA